MAARKWFLAETASEFSEDRCSSMAAALAYYTVFSLPPLLVILVSVAGLFLGREAVEGRLFGELSTAVGPEVANQLRGVLQRQAASGKTGIAALVGLGVLLVGATGAFSQLQSALNEAWDVTPDPRRHGVGAVVLTVLRRLLSFGMLIVVAFLLLVATAAAAAISAFGEVIATWLGGLGVPFLYGLQVGLSLLVATGLFAAMFKVLPDVRVGWRDVGVGALITGVLFVIGKEAIALYVAKAHVGSVYGSAGTLVVLLVWIYYAALIVLFGAEATQVWARRHHRDLPPKKGAVRKPPEVPRLETVPDAR